MSAPGPFVSRRWRLQFSLRILLLLMATVGAGLAIFRWPWEVTTVDTVATRTTQYRRGWNGQALPHGSDRLVVSRTEQATWEKEYFDGVLVRERDFRPPGVLRQEKRYIPDRGETRTTEFEGDGDDQLIIESVYREPDRYHHQQWKTSAGQTLESVATRAGRIIEWNGQPFEEEMTRVLAPLADWREREEWLAPRAASGMTTYKNTGDATYRFRALTGGRGVSDFEHANQQMVSLHFAGAEGRPLSDIEMFFLLYNLPLMGSRRNLPQIPPLAEQLLWELQRCGCTIRCRFGVLCCVPLSPELLDGGDPTGISQIAFERSSPQFRDWNRLTFPLRETIASHAERLQDFFADTSLLVDLSQVSHDVERPPPNDSDDRIIPQLAFPHDSTHLRPRRDVFGLFLAHNNYRVEQQGNKLVVLPRTNGS